MVRRRQSDADGCPYALTLAFDGQIYHMLIRRRDNGKFSLGAERPDQPVCTYAFLSVCHSVSTCMCNMVLQGAPLQSFWVDQIPRFPPSNSTLSPFSFPFPPHFLPSLPFSFFSLLLEVGLLNTSSRSGELQNWRGRSKLPQQHLGQSPSGKQIT